MHTRTWETHRLCAHSANANVHHIHYTYTHPSKTDGIHMHWAHSLYIQLLVIHTYTIPLCTVLCTHYMCISHTLHTHCYMSSRINTLHMYCKHKPLHTHTATHEPHTSSVRHIYTTCPWQIHTAYILYMHMHCYTYITLPWQPRIAYTLYTHVQLHICITCTPCAATHSTCSFLFLYLHLKHAYSMYQ